MMRLVIFLIVLLALAHPAWAQESELGLRTRIKAEVAALFLNKKFDDLNKRAEQYRTTEEKTPSGVWKLTSFYRAMLQFPDDEQHWQNALATAREWMDQNPSPAACVSDAELLVHYAWVKRGNGYAAQVKPENWKPYFASLQRAHALLDTCKVVASVDPEWYRAMILVAKGEQWPEKETVLLYLEAMTKHPYYYEIYFAIMDALQPKWSGSKEAMESFANQATEYTKAKEGTSMYVRLYWYISQCNCSRLTNLFDSTLVNWDKMKISMRDVLARYPDAWNTNNFAYLSCRAKDKDMTKSLLSHIQMPIFEAWANSMDYYNYCKAWADQP